MKAWQRWTISLGLAVVALLGIALPALLWWLPTDDALALRLASEAEERLGVKISIGSVHWALLPTPAIIVVDIRTLQTPAIAIGTLSVYPNLQMLLRRKLVVARMDVRDATLPRNALHALQVTPNTMEWFGGDDAPLEHLVFRNLTWTSYSGIAVIFDGEIDFDPHWRPRHAELRRPGVNPPFTLTATRESEADRWQTQIFVGGGTAHGHVALKTAASGAMHLSGQLGPRGIEVASALNTFNRRSPLSGTGNGQTTLWADGTSVGQLTRSLHTQTLLTVHAATLLRFDLDKAIHTRGQEHDGQTPLQELSGQLDTQNGPEGMRVTGTGVRARAGQFTATGKGTLYHGQIQASGNLDLVEGAVGVPISLSGPVQKPKVSAPPGFFAGAAIGTAVLPGIGTVIGARIGGALGKVFKGDAPEPVAMKKESVPPK